MRKNLYVGLLLIVMTFMLVGCITIPLGNNGGVIKISESGIEYVKDDEETVAVEEEVEKEEVEKDDEEEDNTTGFVLQDTEEKQTNQVDSEENKDEPSAPINSDASNADEEKKEKTKGKVIELDEKVEKEKTDKSVDNNSEEEAIRYEGEPEIDTECNFDNSEFTDHIGVDIYIPYCAILLGVVEFEHGVSAGFLVDLVSYDHIANNYRAFFGPGRDEYFDTDLVEDWHERSILISGRLKDGGKLYAHLEQRQGYVYLLLDYR